MAVTRWNPWGDLFALTDTIDHVFGRVPSMARGEVAAFLPLDVRQTDEAYIIEASVPGFSPEEVEVTLDENVLTIRAQHTKEEAEDDKGGYVRRERRSTSFFRQVGLPAEVRGEEISASFVNGVLTVKVPRTQRSQPRRIAVRGAGDADKVTVEAASEQRA
jgi:HSP20 family protein